MIHKIREYVFQTVKHDQVVVYFYYKRGFKQWSLILKFFMNMQVVKIIHIKPISVICLFILLLSQAHSLP